MRSLTIRLVLPLSFIIFILFTKWWLVETDLSVNYLYGFPLPYTAACPAGNGCIQYFIMPLAVDLFVYFIAVFIIAWLIRRYHRVYVPPAIGYLLWAINILYYAPAIAHKSNAGSTEIYWQREFRIFKTVKTGYLFMWEEQPTIDYTRYKKPQVSLPE